ncbi:TatD family hydrolase [Paenibacillus chartarius]|uniref:TatD family hydrolase n=1 Tax=Paenibacillus chartarius TaxID=747481 RepID=A0ABV6DVI9_9BACL
MAERLLMIDTHIHLDIYDPHQREELLQECFEHKEVTNVIAVSMHMASCLVNKRLAASNPQFIRPAYGYHPEQTPLQEKELQELLVWIRRHADEAVAIGEVGLPYYSRQEAADRGEPFDQEPYIAMLQRFVALADELDKPIVLHAVYEDADIACRLLANYPRVRAHFHWFKGSMETVRLMAQRGYMISVTPDVLYEEEIRELVRLYPLELIMTETDGPWPFEGPFQGKPTRPHMMRESIAVIAGLKGLSVEETAQRLYDNASRFYRLNS